MHRILYISSSHSPWYSKGTTAKEHFANAPYSIDAIGYNLEKRGWVVAWLGWADTHNPFHLAKEIDDFKPDIIYTYGGLVGLNPLIARRYICTHKAFKIVHGWDDEYGIIAQYAVPKPFNFLARIFFDCMEKRIVKHSDAVVTLSRYLMLKGAKWGIGCHYIPNGADEVEMPDTASSAIKLEGRFNVVYCGDKAKWKRVEPLCQAMAQLPLDIKLYLTGRNEDYLAKYASPNCIFLGYIPRQDQMSVMSQANAFVFTANQDCNAKLQEYLRWKKPIIGYDGRPNLFFKNGRNALLTKDYASAILRLANDPELCTQIAANASADIPIYSWPEIATQHEEYFNSIR